MKAAWDSHKRASASRDTTLALIQIFAEDIGHVQRLRGVCDFGTVLLNVVVDIASRHLRHQLALDGKRSDAVVA